MKRILLAIIAALCLFACGLKPDPKPPTPDGGTGGVSFATGGAAATGGNSATAGTSATGGDAATGGAVATGGTTSAIDWPGCDPPTQKAKPVDVERLRNMLQPYHKGQITKRARASYSVLTLPDCAWFPLCPTLDQLNLGSCTGNAATQVRCSDVWGVPVSWMGWDALRLEAYAVDVYGAATHLDPFRGAYPPDDTGSDGASVLTVLKQRGLISGFTSAITFEGIQRALQSGPGIMGSPWYTAMFSPDRCGQISIGGVVEGGHETVLRAVQYSTKRFLFQNSWGNDWGAKRKGQGGYFWLTFGSVQRLLNEGADFEFPQVGPANSNAAEPLQPTG